MKKKIKRTGFVSKKLRIGVKKEKCVNQKRLWTRKSEEDR